MSNATATSTGDPSVRVRGSARAGDGSRPHAWRDGLPLWPPPFRVWTQIPQGRVGNKQRTGPMRRGRSLRTQGRHAPASLRSVPCSVRWGAVSWGLPQGAPPSQPTWPDSSCNTATGSHHPGPSRRSHCVVTPQASYVFSERFILTLRQPCLFPPLGYRALGRPLSYTLL